MNKIVILVGFSLLAGVLALGIGCVRFCPGEPLDPEDIEIEERPKQPEEIIKVRIKEIYPYNSVPQYVWVTDYEVMQGQPDHYEVYGRKGDLSVGEVVELRPALRNQWFVRDLIIECYLAIPDHY